MAKYLQVRTNTGFGQAHRRETRVVEVKADETPPEGAVKTDAKAKVHDWRSDRVTDDD